MNNQLNQQKIEYPTISKRIGAMFFDLIVLYFIYLISALIFQLFNTDNESLKIIIFLIIAVLYEPVFYSKFSCTIGQFLVNLRVKKKNNTNEKINFINAIFRFYTKYLFGILSIFYAGFNKEKRTIHDQISGSIVLYAAKDNTSAFLVIDIFFDGL